LALMCGAVEGMEAVLPDHPDTAKMRSTLASWAAGE
jgi:hypothetical protein